jgi:hypothetical protein
MIMVIAENTVVVVVEKIYILIKITLVLQRKIRHMDSRQSLYK